MEGITVFIFGLFLGSFANVVILRFNTGEPFVFGRSRCLYCAKKLKWFELIPVLSFLFLRGRCRTCASKISWQYPAIEFLSGLLFLTLFIKIQPNFKFQISNFETLRFASTALFFWLLFVISVYDARHKIIPNVLVYPAIFLAFLFQILNSKFQIQTLIPSLLSAFGFFSFFGGLWFVSRGRWMGFGDAKMALAMSLFLGWPSSFAAFLFSFWFGALFGIGLVLFKGLKNTRGKQIPFGPFLFLGTFTAFLWGERVITWYITLL